MKQGIHPDYHPVVFQDASTGYKFLSGSTVTSRATVVATSMALKELNELDLNRFSKCRTQN